MCIRDRSNRDTREAYLLDLKSFPPPESVVFFTVPLVDLSSSALMFFSEDVLLSGLFVSEGEEPDAATTLAVGLSRAVKDVMWDFLGADLKVDEVFRDGTSISPQLYGCTRRRKMSTCSASV